MANGEMNHPEPLERHGDNDEDEDNNGDGAAAENDMSLSTTSEQDELLEEIEEQDYSALEQTLDQLNSCLDQLDQKNDDFNAKVRALLAASRQDYEELASARTAGDAGSSEGQST